MNKLALIAGGSTLAYACLALMMGVLPGIELRIPNAAPAGRRLRPGLCPAFWGF